MSFNQFILPSDTVSTHGTTQCQDSWWTAYAVPGRPQRDFYAAVREQDETRFSRQTKTIPVFNDVRFGGFKPTYQMAEWDPK